MKIFTPLILTGLAFFQLLSPASASDPDGRKTPYLGYSWPFAGQNINSEIGKTPILLEMFSDQGCMYCPPADQFFNDLVKKTRITALAYHVNTLNIVTDNPYATQGAYDRHLFYSVLLRERRYTPEIVINGRLIAKGYMFQEVIEALKSAAPPPPISLNILKDKTKNSYHVHLDAMKLGELEGFDDHVMVKLIEYQKPVRSPIKTGPNEGMAIEYLHVVSTITPLENWAGDERDYTFTWAPSKDAAGAVLVLERKDTGLVAFGEIKKSD